jgi:hypothetical protein
MTHYYYLICAGAQVDQNTQFFRVGVGASRQANSDFLFLTAAAVDKGWYFERVSAESDDFIRKLAESLYPTTDSTSLLRLQVKQCLVRDVVRAIKKGEALPSDVNSAKNRLNSLQFLSLNYRVAQVKSRR